MKRKRLQSYFFFKFFLFYQSLPLLRRDFSTPTRQRKFRPHARTHPATFDRAHAHAAPKAYNDFPQAERSLSADRYPPVCEYRREWTAADPKLAAAVETRRTLESSARYGRNWLGTENCSSAAASLRSPLRAEKISPNVEISREAKRKERREGKKEKVLIRL